MRRDRARLGRARRADDPAALSPAKAHLWLTLAPLFPAFQADIDRVGVFLRSHLAASGGSVDGAAAATLRDAADVRAL